MIIIQVAGGLGNQLQQYALYTKLVSIGKTVKLDLSWFEDEKGKTKNSVTSGRNLELAYLSGVTYKVCNGNEINALTGGKGIVGKLRRKIFPATIHWFHESKIYHPEIFSFDNMYISGYFACEKYYADILCDLRKKIQFPDSSNPENEQMAERIKNSPSVSVHVRRGDYLNSENAAMFGNICTEEYYQKAIELIKKSVPNAQFYVFSDDISYVKQRFAGEEYTIVDINHGKDAFYDMWLMSLCEHNICANSTFSFWGARLNANEKKIMIRPTIHKNSQVFVKEEMEKLWEGWKFVSPEGEEI